MTENVQTKFNIIIILILKRKMQYKINLSYLQSNKKKDKMSKEGVSNEYKNKSKCSLRKQPALPNILLLINQYILLLKFFQK